MADGAGSRMPILRPVALALRPRGGCRLAEVRNDVARQRVGVSVELALSTRTVGDRTVVEVGGEIDVYTAPKLREQLVELVNDGSFHLVVDMEGVDFLDSN